MIMSVHNSLLHTSYFLIIRFLQYFLYFALEDIVTFFPKEERLSFSMPIEYKRCRYCATPRWIKRSEEVLGFRKISDKYSERYAEAIKKWDDFRLDFVGIIDADRMNIDQAVSIGLLKLDKSGKLLNARLAPCCPNI